MIYIYMIFFLFLTKFTGLGVNMALYIPFQFNYLIISSRTDSFSFSSTYLHNGSKKNTNRFLLLIYTECNTKSIIILLFNMTLLISF